MKNLTFLLAFAITSACSSTNNKGEDSKEDISGAVPVITLTKAPPSPEYSDASLILGSIDKQAEDSGLFVTHNFQVSNYELGAQTSDAETRGIANSGKGQHVHFIVNNGPYSAHYMNTLNNKFNPGNWTILAFLSRSYHESVKSENAYYIENLKVGESEIEAADLTAQHLFYSRPKGTYKGVDTKKLMLDFYLVNTTISPDGNKVRATINENEFMIDEWAPHYIEGLPMGEVSIKLELLDPEGNLIEGPFNSIERLVTLSK